MPTLPLYSQPTHPDAWHHITSPGGQECWRFDAEDAENERRVVVEFIEGLIDHPAYARAYRNYLRHPTTHRPPLPNEFVGVRACIYEAGRVKARTSIRYPSDRFAATIDSPHVTIGPNRIETLADGRIEVSLRLGETIAADLSFRPRAFQSANPSIADNMGWWQVAQPICDVEGTLSIEGVSIRFDGLGCEEHRVKLSGPSFRTSELHGRILLDNFLYSFQVVGSKARLVQFDGQSMTETDVLIQRSVNHRMTGTFIRYPEELELEPRVRIEKPRVIGSSLLGASLTYQVILENRGNVQAWCEIVYPHRARALPLRPFVSRWVDATA